jgi:hypothetical protein
MTAKTLRRLLLGVVALIVALGAVVASAAPKPPTPDFTLALDSSTSSVTAGQTAAYKVTIARSNGFAADITPTLAGAPSGSTVTFSPNPAGATATQFVVGVATSATTNGGSYPLTFTGTSGSLKHTVSLPLTITAAAPASFSLTVTNDNQNVQQGDAAVYTIAINRKTFTGAIAFTVTGIPNQAIATFAPSSASGNATVLQVDTSNTSPLGSYSLTVKGTSGSLSSSVIAHLTVSAGSNGKNFTISGNVSTPLAPGVSAPINLALTNPNNQALKITALVVTVKGTSKSACGADNFSVRQFSGTVTVPANSTKTLSQLGVVSAAMPMLTFVDKPVNQDICKGVTIGLAYTGAGGKA